MLYIFHVLTAKTKFLDKALLRYRTSPSPRACTSMYFAFGFVLLPTIALASPMLDKLPNEPADTTGYMALPRSLTANWRMLGCSPDMDWRFVVEAGVVQGAGLGMVLRRSPRRRSAHSIRYTARKTLFRCSRPWQALERLVDDVGEAAGDRRGRAHQTRCGAGRIRSVPP